MHAEGFQDSIHAGPPGEPVVVTAIITVVKLGLTKGMGKPCQCVEGHFSLVLGSSSDSGGLPFSVF